MTSSSSFFTVCTVAFCPPVEENSFKREEKREMCLYIKSLQTSAANSLETSTQFPQMAHF